MNIGHAYVKMATGGSTLEDAQATHRKFVIYARRGDTSDKGYRAEEQYPADVGDWAFIPDTVPNPPLRFAIQPIVSLKAADMMRNRGTSQPAVVPVPMSIATPQPAAAAGGSLSSTVQSIRDYLTTSIGSGIRQRLELEYSDNHRLYRYVSLASRIPEMREYLRSRRTTRTVGSSQPSPSHI